MGDLIINGCILQFVKTCTQKWIHTETLTTQTHVTEEFSEDSIFGMIKAVFTTVFETSASLEV